MTIYKIIPDGSSDSTYYIDTGKSVFVYVAYDDDIFVDPHLNHSTISEWLDDCRKLGLTVEEYHIPD